MKTAEDKNVLKDCLKLHIKKYADMSDRLGFGERNNYQQKLKLKFDAKLINS